MSHSRATASALLLVTVLGCALPAWLVTLPPAADLPQHLAQVEQALFRELGPGEYVAWWAPNNLVYLPIAGLRLLVGPERLASATIGLLGALWAAAACLLGWRRQRPLGGVALASALFFNAILGWGMLNFLLGCPMLLVWLATSATPPASVEPDAAARVASPGAWLRAFVPRAVLGWLLLWAHALCFAAACAFAGMLALAGPAQRSRPQRLQPLLTLVPTGLYAAVWVFGLGRERGARGFDVAAHYAVSLMERLDPDYFLPRCVSAGAFSWAFFGVLLGWVLAGLLRPGPERRWDRALASCAGLLGLAYLGLPSKYLNTIEFSSRWLPCLCTLLVLASPGPPAPARPTTLLASAALLLASISSAWNWLTFERTELSGLSAALQATPARARVLGLDFLKASALVEGRPFLHLGSYASLLRGASTQFDFSEHGTALIRGAQRPRHWTPGLEWFAERAQPGDFAQFDVALVGAPPEFHEDVLAALPWLTASTHSGLWRLYAIDAGRASRAQAGADLTPDAQLPSAGLEETGAGPGSGR